MHEGRCQSKAKQAIEEAIDYMVSEDILEQQIEPHTMGIFCHLSSQAIGRSKALPGC